MTHPKSPLSAPLSRRGLLTAGALLLGAGLGAPTQAQTAQGGEAGEAGAVDGLDPQVGFLVLLGLFDATYRIAGELQALGQTALAAEHLEFSHHAHYEDIADGVIARGFAPFEDQTHAYAAALGTGEDAQARLAGLLDIVATIRASEGAAHRMHADEVLLRIAGNDYAGGVEAGQVLAEQEYHDAWGFTQSARADLEALSQQPEPVAAAALRALRALEPIAALFPGLLATEIAPEVADASVLHGAAARVEIARLRL